MIFHLPLLIRRFMEEIEYKIWFSKLNISNKMKLKLLDKFDNVKNIWNANINDFNNKEIPRKNNF